jgi:hypothetical protein
MNLSLREIVVFAPLIRAFWIGLYAKPFFDILDSPVAQIVEGVHPEYYAKRNLRNPLVPVPEGYSAPLSSKLASLPRRHSAERSRRKPL